MTVIQSIEGKPFFTLNGKKYPRIYQAVAQGDNHIAIYNIHDIRNQILSQTFYSDVEINGVVESNQDTLLETLIPILYSEKYIIDNTTIGNDRITASTQAPSGVPLDGEEWVIYNDTI